MADPRFYTNRGPFRLADVCARLDLPIPPGARADAAIADVAALEVAGPNHLVFCTGKAAAAQLERSTAGFAIVDPNLSISAPESMVVLRTGAPLASFATVAGMLYPDHAWVEWERDVVSPSAKIGKDVQVAPGAVIGRDAEIGDRTRISPSAVIGPGVLIGRDCDIGGNVTITHSYLGDGISILPGAQIGQPGFGFVSSRSGHAKVPQLGRVIIQDKVEIGACTCIDRGALGETVIGEGTKIDNLVQIAHNCRVGRHCVIVAQVGIAGSSELGDFVVLGGQSAIADHVKIGDGARLAARAGVPSGELPGGQDYGGMPAIPVREWRRQMAAYAMLGRRRKPNANG